MIDIDLSQVESSLSDIAGSLQDNSEIGRKLLSIDQNIGRLVAAVEKLTTVLTNKK